MLQRVSARQVSDLDQQNTQSRLTQYAIKLLPLAKERGAARHDTRHEAQTTIATSYLSEQIVLVVRERYSWNNEYDYQLFELVELMLLLCRCNLK
jgi:hypothetical protein